MDQHGLDGSLMPPENGGHLRPVKNPRDRAPFGALELVSEVGEVDIDPAVVHDALTALLVRYHHATQAAVSKRS